MSSAAASAAGVGKKAVHVKWAGKTIALGTFPASEADEKCAKAKALTRAWRSSMRPKPSREWVMLELEQLGVRVVSGRLGRKAGEEGDEASAGEKKGMAIPSQAMAGGGAAQAMGPDGGMPRNNSMGWGSEADLTNLLQSRRNSSMGLSMMNDTMGRRGSLSSLIGLEGDPTMPPYRPFVGGGAAAAFEAKRHDHLLQESAKQQRRTSSLALGSLGGGGISSMGMSVNPNQHYEMLKLHHMNLLNEIQETTLMMNLYQQQQLQQQQQQLQQQAAVDQLGSNGTDSQLSMLMMQNNAMSGGQDPFFGASQMQQRASLGLGGSQLTGSGNFGGQNSSLLAASNNNGATEGAAPELTGKDTGAKDGSPNKRSAEGDTEPSAKRTKTDASLK